MIHVHRLTGCSPTPLAHYLKGLGILRLVANQDDAHARGWWKDESFCLATVLDKEALVDFFLSRYCPTPLIAPWNNGSGFYPKDAQKGIELIERSEASRFDAYRKAIQRGRELTFGLKQSPKDAEKVGMLLSCQQSSRGSSRDWIDAAVVLTQDNDKLVPKYPSLLGTGGNDGRLDFTNNFMQRLADLFDLSSPAATIKSRADSLLEAALYQVPESGYSKGSAVGQFLPGGAGGANSTAGFSGASLVNPWDFVLMLEGTLLFISSAQRQLETGHSALAAAPFAVYSQAVGYGSSSEDEKRVRGEQWMPLWDSPATFGEIKKVMSEARNQLGKRRVTKPINFARSIARLGVARGFSAFERYGYIERNGQANLATPLGRWTVRAQPRQNLIDEISGWVDHLSSTATDDHAPGAMKLVARNCQERVLACCRNGANSENWRALLISLAEAELQMVRSSSFTTKKRLHPLPSISSEWLNACGTDPELQLANSIAGLVGAELHWLPLEPNRRRFAVLNDRLVEDSDVVCHGYNLIDDLIALQRRRNQSPKKTRDTTMEWLNGSDVRLPDISAFLAGGVDESQVLLLAVGLMAIKRNKDEQHQNKAFSTQDTDFLAVYSLFRIATMKCPPNCAAAKGVRQIPVIFNRLSAGHVAQAGELALRRLRMNGLRPTIRRIMANTQQARRIAASLAFKISEIDAAEITRRLTKPFTKLENHLDQES